MAHASDGCPVAHKLLVQTILLSSLVAGAGLVEAAPEIARGVDPAQIDTRVDLIFEHESLSPTGSRQTFVVKYDQALAKNDRHASGFNIEVPVMNQLSVAGFDAYGIGDIFARYRYVVNAGTFQYGGAAEVVLPTAQDESLGSNKLQANIAGLIVLPWSAQNITALAVKSVQSVAGESADPDIGQHQVRLVQALMNQSGGYLLGDIALWHDRENDLDWRNYELEVGQMLSSAQGVSLRLGKSEGDRENDYAVKMGWKRFF